MISDKHSVVGGELGKKLEVELVSQAKTWIVDSPAEGKQHSSTIR